MKARLKHELLFLVTAQVRGFCLPGGVYTDPNHHVSDESLGGLRFIAPSPSNEVIVIGTDDGAQWWWLQGTCSGGSLNTTFDFSPKGGPNQLIGTSAIGPEGTTITWPDGNAWTLIAEPTAAFEYTLAFTYHGLFLDPQHYVPGTFAGMRVIAERPQHKLHMLGSDDGVSWYHLTGICHDVEHDDNPMFRFDFSPKGGPAELTAKWDHTSLIRFPDGNRWYKPAYAPNTIFPAVSRPLTRALTLPTGGPLLATFALVAGLFGATVGLARVRKASATIF